MSTLEATDICQSTLTPIKDQDIHYNKWKYAMSTYHWYDSCWGKSWDGILKQNDGTTPDYSFTLSFPLDSKGTTIKGEHLCIKHYKRLKLSCNMCTYKM